MALHSMRAVRVVELWRYPVKSLGGEPVEQAESPPNGLPGDRGSALFDRETGVGLTARRVPELLFASARLEASGRVCITLPDGSVASGDDALSAWLGRAVELRAASDRAGTRIFENPVD